MHKCIDRRLGRQAHIYRQVFAGRHKYTDRCLLAGTSIQTGAEVDRHKYTDKYLGWQAQIYSQVLRQPGTNVQTDP
jgi:hypothetical protein